MGYAGNELWLLILPQFAENLRQYKISQRVSILLTWRKIEFKIFISSETDGYNLNFTKYGQLMGVGVARNAIKKPENPSFVFSRPKPAGWLYK